MKYFIYMFNGLKEKFAARQASSAEKMIYIQKMRKIYTTYCIIGIGLACVELQGAPQIP